MERPALLITLFIQMPTNDKMSLRAQVHYSGVTVCINNVRRTPIANDHSVLAADYLSTIGLLELIFTVITMGEHHIVAHVTTFYTPQDQPFINNISSLLSHFNSPMHQNIK